MHYRTIEIDLNAGENHHFSIGIQGKPLFKQCKQYYLLTSINYFSLLLEKHGHGMSTNLFSPASGAGMPVGHD